MQKPENNLQNMWETIVQKHPDEKAVWYQNQFFTFIEIDEKSNQVANYILKYTESVNIGVMIDNSSDYVCAVLGVLKTGKCFVPLDPSWPIDRIEYVKKNCTLECIITSSEWITDSKQQLIDDIYKNESKDFNHWKEGKTAYILHSSGTTGKPKGIAIGVKSLFNLVQWFNDAFLSESIDNILQLAKISFDVSIEEIFGTLFNGKTLFIPPTIVRYHKGKMRNYIEEHQINLIETVPVTLKEFFDVEEKITCLKTIICGADVLHEELKNSIISVGYDLYNNYGPTETTVDAMYHKCSLEEPVQLGKCVSGCEYVILLESGEELSGSGIGEICFSGVNLAEGYIGNAELNACKFVEWQGRRLYKSGDLVKKDEQNRIIYIGRMDNQIKLRGQRIELEEIERVFADAMEVKLCATICKKEGNEKLLMFYESTEAFEHSDIVARLRKKLPEYMIPSTFVRLQNMPLTDNGKVDRKALSMYEEENGKTINTHEYDEMTSKMVEIMAEILELSEEEIDLQQSLEQIGFDSLSFVRFLVEIEENWDVEMDEDMLVPDEEQTVFELLEVIKKYILEVLYE